MDIVNGSLRAVVAVGEAGQKLAGTLFGSSRGDVANAAEVERLRRRVANLEHRLEKVEERGAPPETATPADMPAHASPPALPVEAPAKRGGGTRTGKKAPAKAAASKAPARKAPASKAPARKAPARKAPARKAPARKAPATKAPATKAPATRAPAAKASTRGGTTA